MPPGGSDDGSSEGRSRSSLPNHGSSEARRRWSLPDTLLEVSACRIAGVLAEEAPPWLSKRPMTLSAWKLSELPCVTLAAVSTEFRCRRKPKRLGRLTSSLCLRVIGVLRVESQPRYEHLQPDARRHRVVRLKCPRYGVLTVGSPNVAAPIGTFTFTSLNSKLSRPSSQANVQRNGNLMPPTSR
jgi:hypothetical protein